MTHFNKTLFLGLLVGLGFQGCGLIQVTTSVNGETKTYGGNKAKPVRSNPVVAQTPAAKPRVATGVSKPPVYQGVTPPGVIPPNYHAAPTKPVSVLPTVAQVEAVIQDSAQREAAFKVMGNYVAFMRLSATDSRGPVTISSMSVEEQGRHTGREYEFEKAQSAIRPLNVRYGLSDRAHLIYQDPTFHMSVVEKVVSPTAAAEYSHSRFYQDVARDAPALAKQRTAQSIASAVEANTKSGVDRTVFGIELGKPLRLPQCSNDFDDAALMSGLLGGSQGITETCRGNAAGNMALAITQLATQATGVKAIESEIEQVSVKLADNACPDWARVPGQCHIFIAVHAGVALGATITVTPLTGKDVKLLTDQLTKKYKKKPELGDGSSCINQWTGAEIARVQSYTWSLPGLTAQYDPLGFGNCQQGILKVDLDYLKEFKDQENLIRQEKGPKF